MDVTNKLLKQSVRNTAQGTFSIMTMLNVIEKFHTTINTMGFTVENL